MPHTAGLRRSVAAVLISVCFWWADRRMEQSTRWMERARKARAWGEQTEPQTRS
jgi:hypothetical protein